MTAPVPRGALALAGVGAGFLVGVGDGVRSALLIGADARGVLAAALLAGGVDAVLGGIGGLLVEVVARLAVWGRGARPVRPARVAALVVAAAIAAVVTVAAVVAMASRRNRFLAGGVVVVAATATGLALAALAPALARLLSGRRLWRAPAAAGAPTERAPWFRPVLLLLVPLAVVAVDLVVFRAGLRARAPLGAARVARLAAIAAVEAALLPALLLWAESLPLRVRVPLAVAAGLAAAMFGVPAVVAVASNWSLHLRFIPWTHVVVAALIAAGALALVLAPALAPRLVRRLRALSLGRRAAVLAGALALAATLVLAASASEPARKAIAARAGLGGPALAAVRAALDRDGDGTPRLLGGGDCDDGDPTIHPGALDVPDDGLDQDCDGSDASMAVLDPPPFASVPDSVPRDLNFLFVTIDTLRADHLGCYGYRRPTSPAIDRLAAEGALFENGWAHAPSTRYSMPALATARWPSAISWDESIWWPRIGPGERTIGEALKAAGYATGAFYSYDYFAPRDRRGFERGIDVYRADRAVLHQAVNGPMESRGSSSRQMADDAIAFVEAHRDQKFFLWVHFYDPHLSYDPHPEVPPFGGTRVDGYDGEIRFTDLHLGRLLDRLRDLGLWGKTAVILTGDHGEGFGEHGVTEHGFDLYAPQTKVPVIVRVPGLPGRRVRAPAGHVDLGPTMLNLARAPREPAFLGRSLLPEIAGAAPAVGPARPLFQEVSSERGKKRAMVTEELHLIWNWTPENTTECYDLAADPEERHDLWGGRGAAAGCERLKRELQQMVSALSVPPGTAHELARSVFAAGAPAPPPPPAPLAGATLGDAVAVLGFGPAAGTAAAQVSSASGGAVELLHLFESRKPVAEGWRFFFHLLGPGGGFHNIDHVPVRGAMPPERWRPGQKIIDRYQLVIPPGTPPGRYQVALGLYRGGQRMPVRLASGAVAEGALRTAVIEVR